MQNLGAISLSAFAYQPVVVFNAVLNGKREGSCYIKNQKKNTGSGNTATSTEENTCMFALSA